MVQRVGKESAQGQEMHREVLATILEPNSGPHHLQFRDRVLDTIKPKFSQLLGKYAVLDIEYRRSGDSTGE